MPITTTGWPEKRASIFFEVARMWMQLMQPEVQKSTTTTRPFRSARSRG